MEILLKNQFHCLLGNLKRWLPLAEQYGWKERSDSVKFKWGWRVFENTESKSFFLIKGKTLNVINS